MGANDGTFERGSAIGNTTVPRLSQPQIRGTTRRSDPDGSHAAPFWTGLASTSLTIEVGTFQAGAVTTTTVSFTTNNYADALAAVNSAGGSDFHWLEIGGFICIQSLHSGDKNYLRVTGGTAAAILGIAIDPAPGGYSQAGDLASSSPTNLQSNPPQTKLVAQDESLTSGVVNRAIVGSLSGLDRIVHDLSREVAVWRLVALKFASAGGLILNSTSDANIRISTGALKQALADGYAAEDVIQILNSSRKAYYKATSPVTRVKATGIAYGPGSGTGAITWGTPGSGNLLTTTAAVQSLKQAATGITILSGQTVTAPSATFITNRVQPGDIASIKSASNLTPFNHSGEFVVVEVISETQLVLRPMGPNETLVDATEDKPAALNETGSGFGTIQVYVGYSVPMGGQAATGTDFVYIETNVSDSTGTQAWARLPVAMTLREAIVNGFLADVAFDLDPQIAYLNTANTFALLNTFLAGISVGAVPSAPNTPLVLLDTATNNSTFQLVSETSADSNGRRIRVYANPAGGYIISNGCSYASGTWTSDVGGGGGSAVVYGNGNLSGLYNTASATWLDSSGWTGNLFTLNSAKLDVPSSIEVGGESSSQSLASANTPRINFPLPATITGDATLIFTLAAEWGPFNGTGLSPLFRLYVSAVTGEYRLTYNALWGGDTTGWTRDSASFVAFAWSMKFGVLTALQRLTTDSSPWAETSWSTKNLTTNDNVIIQPVTGTALLAQVSGTTNIKPTIAVQDANGNNKGLYDHMGFRGGERNYEMVENWDEVQGSVTSTTNPLTGWRRWQVLFGGSAVGGEVDAQSAGVVFQTPAVDITLPTSDNIILAMARPVVYVQTFASYVLECELYVPVSLSSGWDIDIGFSSALNGPGQTAIVNANSSSSFWSVITGNPTGGGSSTTLVTTAPFGTFDAGRIRLEIHGASSPYGACVRAFFGGAGPFVVSTHIPTSALMYLLIRSNGGSVGSQHINIGQVRCYCNRYPNPDGL